MSWSGNVWEDVGAEHTPRFGPPFRGRRRANRARVFDFVRLNIRSRIGVLKWYGP